MSFERQDYLAAQREKSSRRTSTMSLGLLSQAAVPAAALMADPHWALYQQLLQGALERQQQNRARLVEALTSTDCNSYEQVTRLKYLLAECDGMLAAWRTAIALPAQLLADAEAARVNLEAALAKHDKNR